MDKRTSNQNQDTSCDSIVDTTSKQKGSVQMVNILKVDVKASIHRMHINEPLKHSSMANRQNAQQDRLQNCYPPQLVCIRP